MHKRRRRAAASVWPAGLSAEDRQARIDARDVSYAHYATTRAGRMMIRLMETATGRMRLLRMGRGYHTQIGAGRPVFETFADLYGVGVSPDARDLAHLPKDGPLIVVANHPFGIADGMAMGRLLEIARGPGAFRIIAHKAFHRASALSELILPISFDESRAAQTENIATRKAALAFLEGGGCVGVFPGGTVSTSRRPFGPARDPRWRNFTAQMIRRSGARVTPLYFEGRNSRLFQVASHLHATLRMGLLTREFKTRVGREVAFHIGAPIDPGDLPQGADALMAELRARVYALSPDPLTDAGPGLDLG